MNPIYTYGKERFFRQCRTAGIDGVIIPDLPFEEKEEVAPICAEYGVELVPLIAPTSNEQMCIRDSPGPVRPGPLILHPARGLKKHLTNAPRVSIL